MKNEKYYCVEDPDQSTTGCESADGKKSPKWLQTTTLTDELKLFSQNKSKVIGISINDYAAIFSAGHKADAAYWYDDKTGQWISSSYYLSALPTWVVEFNEKRFPEFYLTMEWSTMYPVETYTESRNDSSKYESGFGKGKTTFPYVFYEAKGKLSFKKDEINYKLLRPTPFANNLTTDFAIAALTNENMGKDEHPDFLAVTYSASDYLGHKFGPNSVEIEDLYLRLDKNIALLLEYVNTTYGKENVLIFLTSNHGVSDNPSYLKDNKIPAGFFKYHYSIALLKSYLNALYGEGEWVQEYLNQQIYLNRRLLEDAKLSLNEVQEKVSNFMLQFSGVSNSITANSFVTSNFTSGLFQKMQKCFNQNRSGDIMISLQPGWIQDKLDVADHGSGYDYDSHVPLVWYGWKIKRGTISERVFLEQIAPTISDFIGITYPNACESEPIGNLMK